MNFLNRDEIIAEEIVRTYVRKRVQKKLYENRIFENKVRKIVRQLLETETGTEEPSSFTGINVLADLLEKIIPVIEDDYKMLTTSNEQRESFRNHLIQAIKNTLRPIETVDDAEASKMAESEVFEIDKNFLLEKLKIDLDPEEGDPAAAVEGEFIDIDTPDEEEGFVQIDDQNETGRNFAASTFKQVEKQIVDAYDMLADEEDQKLFYDYLITNMLLYFDKFEDELQTTLPSTTTPEYEKEKEEEESEPEADEPEDEPDTEEPEDTGEEELEI
ncbi:MAG TPA: hypothetical protein DF712_01405 [Balneola sp.]|nr:hypothetical protein [Balneola sp.]